MKIIVTIIATELVTNSLLSIFCSLLEIKNKNQILKVGGLVTRNKTVFLFIAVTLYFKTTANSVDIYKGIFLHVIPVCIILPWSLRLLGPYSMYPLSTSSNMITSSYNFNRFCTSILTFRLFILFSLSVSSIPILLLCSINLSLSILLS